MENTSGHWFFIITNFWWNFSLQNFTLLRCRLFDCVSVFWMFSKSNLLANINIFSEYFISKTERRFKLFSYSLSAQQDMWHCNFNLRQDLWVLYSCFFFRLLQKINNRFQYGEIYFVLPLACILWCMHLSRRVLNLCDRHVVIVTQYNSMFRSKASVI